MTDRRHFDDDEYDSTEDDNRAFDPDNDRVAYARSRSFENSIESAESESDRSIEREKRKSKPAKHPEPEAAKAERKDVKEEKSIENEDRKSSNRLPESVASKAEDKESDFTFYD